MSIKENLEQITNKIKNAEIAAGRNAGSVKLMAVSKFHTVEEIEQSIIQGQTLFGENRVQEACEKFTILYEKYPQIHLHIIGQLQTNKVKQAVQIAECIESVDRKSLMDEIEKQCSKIGKNINVLFEVHTGEESKSGFTDEAELISVLQDCNDGKYPHIIPQGFMTMAPFTDDENAIRTSFKTLKTLAQKLNNQFPKLQLNELSMGMSGDFELAIEEGSTLVRVGTAIFGQRDYTKK